MSHLILAMQGAMVGLVLLLGGTVWQDWATDTAHDLRAKNETGASALMAIAARSVLWPWALLFIALEGLVMAAAAFLDWLRSTP